MLRTLARQYTLYYQATTEVLSQQLLDLTDELRRIAGASAIIGTLNTLDDALAAITTLARETPNHPLVVVIDEFPYLADADAGAETVVQRWCDRSQHAAPNLKLFLAGSHVSWMREHTLSEHGPLQNRRTGQIEVLALDYRHAAEFYPHLTPLDKVRAYAIWGGLPGFLREIDPALGLWENVRQSILDPHARLFVEPDWLRFTELRSDQLYTSLVRAIASGQHTPSDIARNVGRHGATDVFDPLNRLVGLGVVERRSAMTVRPSARPPSRYDVADQFLAFWYRFIDRRRSMLRRGQAESALAQIQQEIDSYVAAYVFEHLCREWVWGAVQRGELPSALSISEIGAWWGGTRGEQDEIDVVALSPQDEGVLFGACKWSNAPMDLRDLGGLRKAIAAAQHDVPSIMHPWRLCFSRAGFHPDLVAEAAVAENRIILVDPERLYGIASASSGSANSPE